MQNIVNGLIFCFVSPNKMAQRVPERDNGAKISCRISFDGQLRLDTRAIHALANLVSIVAVTVLVGLFGLPNVDIMKTPAPFASEVILERGGGDPSSSMGIVNSTTETSQVSLRSNLLLSSTTDVARKSDSEDVISILSEFYDEQEDDGNEREKLMFPIRHNGTLPCHHIRTKTAQVQGLPPVKQLQQRKEEGKEQWQQKERLVIRLDAGKIHEIQVISIGDDGKPRCAGGDYYETDLSGPRWKSRPPVRDHKNGTYTVTLQVDPRFVGVYTFKIVLLFSNFHGLDYHPQKYARLEEVATYQIEFFEKLDSRLSISGSGNLRFKPREQGDNPVISSRVSLEINSASTRNSSQQQPQLEMRMCSKEDFKRMKWSGRWTREEFNEDCAYNRRGRWKCVSKNLQCQKPWCEGPVGSLESNGWVYSAHCAFKIFRKEEAWKCLNGKWLFFWGDSNHMDTIRNLLNFVLGFNQKITFLPRRMDTTYFSPSHNRSSVRITSMFNGHRNVTMNHQGLFSLHDKDFAEQLKSFFTGEVAPDFMILNSGLHDGMYWKDIESFLKEGVDFAAEFWNDIWNTMRARRPDLLYRTTVATAGRGRTMPFNPQKMEVFNDLMVDRFSKLNLERFHVVDGFDYTFPWHWDHKNSDGPHYGRPPSRTKWAGNNVGHRYFVDVMLVHMLLNAICEPND